jgi:hypothetical protein
MAESTHLSADREDRERSTAGLRQRIEAERAALDESLTALGGRVHETLDWRRQAARHRGTLIAAGGGLALAGLWRWRRRRQRGPLDRLQATVAHAADHFNEEVRQTLGALRRQAEPRRPGLLQKLLAPLALALVKQMLSRREEDTLRAEAGRPTPGGAPVRGNSAGWKQEEQEWNRESSSTIGA